MMRRLRSIQIRPRDPDGWTSPELTFGERTTLATGPLGSGKTPIMKALAYALGAPVELPPAVRERCASIHLTMAVDEQVHHLERSIEPGVVCAVGPDRGRSNINDDRQLSAWVLDKLGVPEREFASLKGGPTYSYMSVLAPVFLVDQDVGWSAPYVAQESFKFVRDQREEVIRWMLGVPQKHRVVDKSAFQEAKADQAAIQQQILFKRRTIEKLTKEDDRLRATVSPDELMARRSALHDQLRAATTVMESLTRFETALDARLRDLVARRDAVRDLLGVMRRRRDQILSVQVDVQAETEALEQNEVAAAAFRTLCSSENCKFFRQPDDSYGRRLLYLKDQLKDFSLSASQIAVEIESLELESKAAEVAVETLTHEKRQALTHSGAGDTIAAVESLTKEIALVSVMIDRLERLAVERRQLEALINQELRAGEKVAELKPTGGRRENSRLLDARSILAGAFNEWIEALQTPNVPRDAIVDEELRVIIGGERFNSKISHSGSTRTRLVLAFHGALVEASLKMDGHHPPLLALDAPRQNELRPADIRLFVERFENTVGSTVQLVLSATDEAVVRPGDGVVIWSPTYLLGNETRYLGRAQRGE